jgi:UDP-glucose 4-epimerase
LGVLIIGGAGFLGSALANHRNLPKCWPLLKGTDCVYHLAARVSVPESILYSVEHDDLNVRETVSLMTAARDAGIKRVVFTGDHGRGGGDDGGPLPEAP